MYKQSQIHYSLCGHFTTIYNWMFFLDQATLPIKFASPQALILIKIK